MIAFVRHGQSSSNRDGLFVGRADPPLTEVGEHQANLVAQALATLAPSAVISSPLQRARKTADAIAAAYGLVTAVDDRLIELDYGDWDLMPIIDVPAPLAERWRADASFAPPGGESLVDVRTRIVAFCDEHLRGHHDPVIVAVSHVSPIKAAISWSLGVADDRAWRMQLGLASISRVARRGADPMLVSFNETAHLTV